MQSAEGEAMVGPGIFHALHEIGIAIGGVLDPVELARLVAMHAKRLLRADTALVHRWNQELEQLVALASTDAARSGLLVSVRAGEGAVGNAFTNRAPSVVSDYAAWANAIPGPVSAGAAAVASVPLLVAETAVGTLTICHTSPYDFTAEDVRTLSLLAAQVAPMLFTAGMVARSIEAEQRRESLLRVARRLAGESDTMRVLESLLAEAVALLRAEDGMVRRWEPERGGLVPVAGTVPGFKDCPVYSARQCLSGRAFVDRRPFIANDYQQEIGNEAPANLAGVRAAIAAPLLYEGLALGTIAVHTLSPDRRFTAQDAEELELLAGLGAAALVGVERSRLQGVVLAARTAQHTLNNQLALTVGYSELLAYDPDLPGHLREFAWEALRGAQEAAETVVQFQRITHLEETDVDGPTGPIIDLSRSSS